MNRAVYLTLCVTMYAAAMAAVSWAVWQVSPSISSWAIEQFGIRTMMVLMIAVPAACWFIAYRLGRMPSGSSREP